MDKMVYKPPAPQPMSRRVYVLPVSLVERIHEYGQDNGHPSEVAAVRALLEAALGPVDIGDKKP